MKFRNRKKWLIIAQYCLGWTLAFVFLTVVRGVGTTEMGSVQFEIESSRLFSLIMGPLFGSISGYAQIVTEERVYGRVPIQRLLIFRLVFAILFLFLLILFGYFFVINFFNVQVDFATFVVEPGSFAIYFYILFVDFVLSIVRQVNLMLGGRNLIRLIGGKFYDPHEEDRIFMFLDLQSSTQLAEKLGHAKYSRFIQDCFNDLGAVVENEAEIYQYVGDEVVLTWMLKDGLRNQNCLNAFYNFKSQLVGKSAYYDQKYGSQPYFKAGMNSGTVMVAEVGKYKKDIAYHGDTLNTAARIQGKCNEFGEELLISSELKQQLGDSNFTFRTMGSIPLRGKESGVEIFAVAKEK